MNRMIFKSISLRNFKGVRELDLDFHSDITNICGDNGTGKTTIFDAITWVLFGKDSRDREKFQLMTLDENGNEIPRLQHEVRLVLDYDGQEITLIRRKNEKWTKRRGSAVEEKTGTEEERLYNDVPCSVSEWNAKINELCPFEVFKMITSPNYFSYLKSDAQRDILYRMVGDISDDDIAANADGMDFSALISVLKNKSIEEYKKEIASKKRRLKTELDEYPIRIKQCNTTIDGFAGINFRDIEAELAEKKARLEEISDTIAAAGAQAGKFAERKTQIALDLNTVVTKRMGFETDVRNNLFTAYNNASAERRQYDDRGRGVTGQIEALNKSIAFADKQIKTMSLKREECLEERRRIKAQKLVFSDDDFRCPTCGRVLEVEDIEEKKQAMEQRFNQRIAEELEANREKGSNCSLQMIESYKATQVEMKEHLTRLQAELDEIDIWLVNHDAPRKPTQADVVSALANNAEYAALKSREAELKAELNKPLEITESPDTTEMKEAREMLQESIAELNRMLGKKEIIDNNRRMISEYEDLIRKLSQELADLEKTEFEIIAYSKAKINAVESKINAMFSIVKFRLFETQLNGGWKETCEATVNGVPYSVLNSAGRINAGIDIINAISKHNGLQAPIVIDNAESVNELLPTDSQVIRLVVTKDKQLTIK